MSDLILLEDRLWRMIGPARLLQPGEQIAIQDPTAPERLIWLPWPEAIRRLGADWRTALAVQGILPEARPLEAPFGLGLPEIGTDADGRPAAVRPALPGPEDPRTPAERLTDTREVLHHERRRLRLAGIDAGAPLPDGRVLESDPESWRLLSGAIAMALAAVGAGTPEALAAFAGSLGAGWRARDGSVCATSAVEIIGLGQVLAAHVARWDFASQVHRLAINADILDDDDEIDYEATLAALAAIDLSAGWPT